MERLELVAAHRTVEKGAAKHLRQQGKVPGVLYGQGMKNAFLQVDVLDLKRILSQGGASQLVYLKVDDTSSWQPVLLREIQRNIFSGDPTHVDFLSISMTEKITSSVAVSMVGEPVPVSQGTGILLQGASTVEVEGLPGDLPPSLQVDISELGLEEALYVSDLKVPAGIVVLSDPQEMVAQIVHHRLAVEGEEEEEEEVFVAESPEVEVIARGKDEEE
ncbi:MAG: 50S ribosomal protein L25 [Anaerolineae bacterium]|jgi:large subunit ribosomal protein L25